MMTTQVSLWLFDNIGVNWRHWMAMPNTKAEAIAELMLDVAQCFFRIRAAGQKSGLITSWGGGAFGFMRSLATLGPLTVPQIAEMRPTSRQRMQRLADELAADGLVEFIDNPKHRRSKLVQLTRKGAARYREMSAQFLGIASTIGGELNETEIRKTAAVVRRLSADIAARLSSEGV
jgi:DNA-binding MarR family transcriptional regulator